MMEIAALLAPIPSDAPAGVEARSTEAYDVVSTEIDKLTNISASSPVDWALVATHGERILAEQSKDFMLAAWVSAAWLERHGVEGLAAGLALHAGMIEQYWQNGFPPLKRLRGRRNALTWWIERVQAWLESHPLPPLPATTHAAIVEAAQRIDQGLADLDPESPPLIAFVRQLKNLDVEAEAPPSAPAQAAGEPASADAPRGEPADGAPAGAAAHDGSAPDTAQNAGAEGSGSAPTPAPPPATTPAAAAAPAPTHPASAPTSAAAPTRSTPLPTASFAPAQDLASLNEVVAALVPVTEHLAHIGSALLDIAPLHPLLIELNRFAARATILDLPPAQGGTTALMPPPVAIADAFATITGGGNADGIVAFCESRIAAFPFWLDLDHQSARGYGMLGEAGAAMRKAVIKNALAFVERLPGVELLSFSDGTPFASEATRQWLEECRAAQGGQAGPDAFGSAQAQAQAATNEGRHDEAMRLYQSFIQNTHNRRDQFRARIALVELLLNAHGDIDPMPLVQPLIDDCNALGLAEWEPPLFASAWQTIIKACRQALARPAQHDEADKRRQTEQLRQHALQQLARVDFPAATRLSN